MILINNILDTVRTESPDSILIITGKKSYLRTKFIDTIDEINKEFKTTIWNYPKSYPDYNEIFHYAKEKRFDLIISFGGGTVIDVAKIISVGNYLKSYLDLFNKNNIKLSVKHICIPTTFGSGSESTSFAVIYRDNKKYSIQSEVILPTYTLLDHQYTSYLNGKNSYCSIMDSFCQSIESLWSINNTIESSKYALQSISLISQCLNNIKNLTDENRQSLLIASNLSGKAINITKTTAPHAFSYYLTINHNICHGEAVSILFEKFINLNFSYIEDQNKNELMQILEINTKDDFINLFINLKSRLGFLSGLNEIKNLDIEEYSESINVERLQNNPVKINPSKFIKSVI